MRSDRLRPADLAFFATLGSVLTAAALLATGKKRNSAVAAGAAVIGAWSCRALSRRSPRAMPYSLRWSLLLPRGIHSPTSLLHILTPSPGERVLEVGPGIGVHAIPVAHAVCPGGALRALELNADMLGELKKRAAREGVVTLAATAGDARQMPFPEHSFDAAYLISVLGEIPAWPTALAELRRVLKDDGRLVVGELALDPDFIRLAELKRECRALGFSLERLKGGSLSYLALFRKQPSA